MTDKDVGRWASDVIKREPETPSEPETDYLWCPECETEQPCTKVKDDPEMYRCDICGREFTQVESESEEDNYTEETPPFF
jgi:uncharacterized Zn ribbon protein